MHFFGKVDFLNIKTRGLSLLVQPKGILLEYVSGMGHQIHGNVFTERGTMRLEERKLPQ
jgi:hypothetical protein